jgi:hypothetical protein
MSSPSSDRSFAVPLQHLWCVGSKPDGEPCGARAMRGSQYCFWHDPEKEEERQAELARREQFTGAPIVAEAVPLESVADVEALLRQTVLYLATGGRIEPRRATALTGVADRLLRCIQFREMQAELDAAHAEIARLKRRCAEYERERGRPGSSAPDTPARSSAPDHGDVDKSRLNVL